MNRGTVLFHKEFSFNDGDIGEKLIILLNEPDASNQYLFCKTTSKPKYGLHNEGCFNQHNIFVLNPHPVGFKYKTWVQFDDLYLLTAVDLLSAKFKGNVKKIMDLETPIINRIINCVKKSEDISKYHLSLLK